MAGTRTSFLGLAVAALVATATAGAAEAIRPGGVEIKIGPGGLSPSASEMRSPSVFGWVNEDSVAHTVTFDARCALTLAPGERAHCRIGDSYRVFTVGTYHYQVSGTARPEGEIVVVPNMRRITLAASSTRVRAGRPVTLGGTVVGREMEHGLYGADGYHLVTVLRRKAGSGRFLAIRQVRTRRHVSSCSSSLGCVHTGEWSLTVRPNTTVTYVARVWDTPGLQIWANVETRPVVVRVASPAR